MAKWESHADGFVNGDVGVFPYLFGSWEVWIRINGELLTPRIRTMTKSSANGS
jgi:hypothetical protein